ncbi:hypothetical protein G6F56_002726 [Rhizopus delemar]|uniref:Secreted protein n=1 Tax=Rhizopus stolonifer TaxID=4846 RepID=A0A367KJZ9_RHIST|nr:hypothetical protein G6F56_002726 [Rhizopus delemar]RCI02553.1 hypothetical protein CU098_012533 [Rhizopus stolonifer]
MKNFTALMFAMFNFYVMGAYARICCTTFWADSGSILKGTKNVAQIWMQTDGSDHKDCHTAMLVNADYSAVGGCTFNPDNNLVTTYVNLQGVDYHVAWTRSKDTCGAHNWSVTTEGWAKGRFELTDSSRSWSSCAPVWAGF